MRRLSQLPSSFGQHSSNVMIVFGTVLAHQGGWDEIFLVVGPLLILWALLVLANRRAKRMDTDSGSPSQSDKG